MASSNRVIPAGLDKDTRDALNAIWDSLDPFVSDEDVSLSGRRFVESGEADEDDGIPTYGQVQRLMDDLQQSIGSGLTEEETDPWEIVDSFYDLEYGQGMWSIGGPGAASSAPVDAVAGHPGIFKLDSSAGINNYSVFQPSGLGTAGIIHISDFVRFSMVVRPGGGGAVTLNSSSFNIGVGTNVGGTAWLGADSMLFKYDTAVDTQVRAVTRASSTNTETVVQTSITSGNWYKYDIVHYPGERVEFYVNDELKATHTTNIPTGVAMGHGALVQNKVASNRILEIDFVRLVSRLLRDSRWT